MSEQMAKRTAQAAAPAGADDLIGQSASIRKIQEAAAKIAARQSTVMITGETGTGKDVLARFIHRCSPRAAKPFVLIDCSALTEGVFESQLFGHVRGAFTGAIRDALGLFRAGDGGTCFLDEVGELSLAQQAKLLRVVQEHAVRPVGDTRIHAVDVRIISATHRDLRRMVRQETFRQDLFYRLGVVELAMPPLRQRPDDIVPLAQHFLRAQATLYEEPVKRLPPDAQALLHAYSWPGNVRELANVMEHAHVLTSATTLTASDLRPHLPSENADRAGPPDCLCLRELERYAIVRALHRTQYRKAPACRLLGINLRKLNRRIAALGIAAKEI